MSGRHQPEHGADSACPTCQGLGSVLGGDEQRSCPTCHARVECGSCGVLVDIVHTELLNNGRYDWRRCLPCRDKAVMREAVPA
jgi:hypothetical protein